MERRKINVSFESILVMMLLIIFAVSTCLMIIEGSESYKNILNQKEKEENARIALSFINMRIKQNDVQGKILFEPGAVEGKDALVFKHTGDEQGFLTYLFWDEGILWECYTDIATQPTKAFSAQIVPVDALEFEMDQNNNTVNVNTQYTYGKQQLALNSIIALRTSSLEVGQ